MENFQQNIQPQPTVEKKKGIPAVIALAIIAVIAILVGGGIWWYQNLINTEIANLPKIEVPVTQNETASWQTYTNSEYGFEIKYDAKYNLKTNYNHKVGPDDILGQSDITIGDLSIEAAIPGHFYIITIKKGIPSLSDLESFYINPSFAKNISTSKDLKVDGKNAIEMNFFQEVGGGNYVHAVGVVNNNVAFILSEWSGADSADKSDEEFNKMLSTFKFLDQTSNWKTYGDSQRGFEIKYPREYTAEKNLFSTEFSLVFCPPEVTEIDSNGISKCKVKSVMKGAYENQMIYLFTYNNKDDIVAKSYYLLGKNTLDGKYYFLYAPLEQFPQYETIFNNMISTFKFTN